MSPLPPASNSLGRFTAIASGKGGVGKTWFAITLAQALARLGCRVLLFDADFGLANVDVQLGLSPRHDVGMALSGQAALGSVVTAYGTGGFDIIAGQSGCGTLSGLPGHVMDMLLDALATVGQAYDVVLLDLGAGLYPQVRQVSAWADTLLVINTEDPTSITDAYATLKLHTADRPGGMHASSSTKPPLQLLAHALLPCLCRRAALSCIQRPLWQE